MQSIAYNLDVFLNKNLVLIINFIMQIKIQIGKGWNKLNDEFTSKF
jgi:hypothetical protein